MPCRAETCLLWVCPCSDGSCLFVSTRRTQQVKTENEFEKRLMADVVPPEEVGVAFEDIGALDSVKDVLRETVMLPLQRPELFTRGALTRPTRVSDPRRLGCRVRVEVRAALRGVHARVELTRPTRVSVMVLVPRVGRFQARYCDIEIALCFHRFSSTTSVDRASTRSTLGEDGDSTTRERPKLFFVF